MFFNKERQRVRRKVEYNELTDTLKAMVAPLRPYGSVFAYSGGAQKSLKGNYQFFEMDQNRFGGVIIKSIKPALARINIVFCVEE